MCELIAKSYFDTCVIQPRFDRQ